MSKLNIGGIIKAVIAVLIGLVVGGTVTTTINKTENGDTVVSVESKYSLEMAETQPEIPVEVTTGEETKVVDVVTVEEVDGGEVPTEFDGKTKEELNFGKGEYYDTSSPKAFVEATYGKCIDLDGWYGSQCVDYMAAFMYQEYGRWLSTNGTGAAYGIWDAREQNAGEDMLLVVDKHAIPVGTWAVFSGGQYGHVGLVLGYTDDNHVLLAGENQGGPACAGGGAAVNIINMSLNNFLGGFLPKAWYVEPEPEPTPESEPVVEDAYHYVEGDTFGQVLVDLGYSDGTNLWGKEGDVEYYNGQLYDQGILNYYDGKFWNNIPVGTEIKLEHR